MQTNSKDVVFISALRTSIGKFKGIHNKSLAYELGANVIKEILKQTKINPSYVDEVILGQVLTSDQGQNPARQASIEAGLPKEKTALLINQVCGSGLRAIISGYQSIILGDSKMIIAGGQESMSNSDEKLMLKDGLIDVFHNYHMGVTAENVAEKWKITREEQDNFAFQSQTKAIAAIKNKKFESEIIDELNDEHPRVSISLKKLSELKTIFKKVGGTVTAGNSSGINDGAAAVMMMKREDAEKNGLEPLGKIVSWATCGVEPSLMGTGPIPATKLALKKANWSIKDLDLIECNEAFAAQSLAVLKALNISQEIVNVNGGAIALGHPIGASGARIVVTLLHELKRRNISKIIST